MSTENFVGEYKNFANDCYDNKLDFKHEVRKEIKNIILDEFISLDEKVDKLISLSIAIAYEI